MTKVERIRICCTNCKEDTFRAFANEDDEFLRLECVRCGKVFKSPLKPKKPLSAYDFSFEEYE